MARLPDGFGVRLADSVLVLGAGEAFVGGSPLTSMRLAGPVRGLIAERHMRVHDALSARVADRLLATNLGIPDLDGLPEASADDLTVVIPVRDRPEQLERTLNVLRGVRVLVVDDASRHPFGVAQVASRHGAEVIALDHNLGPAAARNVGLSRVTTPYVAFVDSDVQASTEQLLQLTRHFADPRVALVGPKVVGRSPSIHPRWFERYDEVASSLSLGDVAATVRPRAQVAWLPSACLIARAQALGDGFDGQLRVGEDVDLVWRLVSAGHRVRYEPSVQVTHDTRGTLRGWLGRKAFYGTGSAQLATRHGDALAPAVLTPAYGATAALLLARHRCAVPIAVAAWMWGTRSVARHLPATPDSVAVASRVSARGLGWAVRQEAALLLRHWWPIAAATTLLPGPPLAPVRRTARRMVGTALVVDLVVQHGEQRSALSSGVLGPRAVAGRRLDDLAYGAGLWVGALRQRSRVPLTPFLVRRSGGAHGTTSGEQHDR